MSKSSGILSAARLIVLPVILLAILPSILLTSCETEPVSPSQEPLKFGKGVFIVNEGQFLSANASLSYYDPDTDSVRNDVFYRANGVPLGDVGHSMTVMDGEAYIVVNNSGKIYRCSLEDMKFAGKITGLSSPRYILPFRGSTGAEAYISDLYSGKILIADPLMGTVLDSIHIAQEGKRLSSEQMILSGGKVYVACWSFSDQVLVIDAKTHEISDSIRVGMQPNSMVLDREGFLWVLCDGGYVGSPSGYEKASLHRVNLQTLQAETMKIWDDIRVSPTDLCITGAGDSLYLIAEGIYKFSLDMGGIDQAIAEAGGRQFYSLAVDPSNGTVYAGDAVDYQQDGWVYRFSSAGTAIDSFRVGVNPGYFCFTGHDKQ